MTQNHEKTRFDFGTIESPTELGSILKTLLSSSVTSQKSPNVYESCQKMISLEKLRTFTPLQKLPKNVVDMGKQIVATGFENFPKVQKSPNLVTLLSSNITKMMLTISEYTKSESITVSNDKKYAH